MNILALHHRLPYPLNSGMDKVRYNLLRTLSKEHRVTLIAPVFESNSLEDRIQVEQVCSRLIEVPVKDKISQINRSRWLYLKRLGALALQRTPSYVFNNDYPQMAAVIEEEIGQGGYDLVQALSDVTSVYLRVLPANIPKVLGPVDDTVESSRTMARFSHSLRKKVIMWLEHRACLDYQPAISRVAERVLFFSKKDLQHISSLAGGLPAARLLPVAVEFETENENERFKTLIDQEPGSMIFVGGLGALFNRDAVYYFYRYILPYILKAVPKARFYLVGENPAHQFHDLYNDPHVVITGKVDDVRPYIERSAVYVAPIRSGTGLKTKLIEAIRFGKAVVTTDFALESLWDVGKNDVFLTAKTPIAFAEQVIRLLQDDEFRMQQENKARELYEKNYKFETVSKQTLAVYRELEAELRARE